MSRILTLTSTCLLPCWPIELGILYDVGHLNFCRFRSLNRMMIPTTDLQAKLSSAHKGDTTVTSAAGLSAEISPQTLSARDEAFTHHGSPSQTTIHCERSPDTALWTVPNLTGLLLLCTRDPTFNLTKRKRVLTCLLSLDCLA